MVDICGTRYDNGITEGRWGICLFLLEVMPLRKSVRPGLTASFLPLVVVSGWLSLQQQGSCTVISGLSSYCEGVLRETPGAAVNLLPVPQKGSATGRQHWQSQ